MSTFGGLLRHHREAGGLTREKLAHLAGLHERTIALLEDGDTAKPRMNTVSSLADALKLTGAAREQFKAAALGAAATADGEWADLTWPPPDADPHVWLAFIVTTLDERGMADARLALAQWQERTQADPAWLDWAERLMALTADGRLRTGAVRPLPAGDRGSAEGHRAFLGREQEVSELGSFLDRVRHGRGGLALLLGPSGIGKSLLVTRVLAGHRGDSQAEWITFDRSEAGYLGWRRLLEPMWATLRRTELAPASLLRYAPILDDILLVDSLAGSEAEPSATHLPGDAAAAVAALLAYEARRKPLILVIDDAHRGGITSDELLLGVAGRINACRAGLIAALRADEMDEHSPLRGYSEQAGGRTASDVVTPIRLTPLNLSDTAELLSRRQRMPVTPPQEIIEQVARQTGGRPQLIEHIEVRPPADGTGSWVVRLGAEGLRVLLDTINSRPEAERNILRAAAVCAEGEYVDPGLVARITGQDPEFVERVLDKEGRRGSILAPLGFGYQFQHDSWMEELISSCPRDMFHALHARRLALLRADPAADPRQIIRHAIHAGTAAHMSDEELAEVACQAADLDAANYAFSAAAGRYEVAARHATGTQQADLMIRQSDALRFCGRWREARGVLQQAVRVARQLSMPQREAIALVHLERLTWSYGLDEQELTRQFREVMKRLPADETVLLAQVKAGLATKLTIAHRSYENEQASLAREALQQLPAVADTDPLAAADILVCGRAGLTDIVSPDELLEYDRQLLDCALRAGSAFHIGEALSVSIVDLLHAGRLSDLPAAVRAHRDFAERSAAPTAIYGQALVDGMLALAEGEFKKAESCNAEAVRRSRDWGGSMANEALTAQVGWLLYETGKVDGLAGLVADLQRQSVSSVSGEIWQLGTGLIHAESGNAGPAIDVLREVCAATDDLKGLIRGPGRMGILATAAMVLGHPVVCDEIPADEARRIGTSIAGLLADHPDTFVIAGWPAVLLGSKHRYIGLACLAAGQAEIAAGQFARAAKENSEFKVLNTRSRFDLARALMRQPDRYQEGVDEMGRVHQKAEELQMKGLTAQAAAYIGRAH